MVLLAAFTGNHTSDVYTSALMQFLEVLNDRLSSIPNGAITLGDLVKGSPHLTRFLTESLDLAPDLIEALLHIGTKEPASLSSFLMTLVNTSDPWRHACERSASYYKTLFAFPETIDVERGLQVMCMNDSVLMAEFLDLIGVSKILESLKNPPRSLSEADQSIYEELAANLARLLANTSVDWDSMMDTEQIEQAVQRVLNSANSNDVGAMLRTYWKNMHALFELPGIGPVYKTYVNVLVAMMDYFNQMVGKHKAGDGVIDLGDLFADSATLRKLIQDFTKATPAAADMLVNAKIRVEKVS